MLLLAQLFGWQYQRAIFYGFVLALSSTAVGIKILEDIGELRTETGRCAVGVLIAQDLAVVPMLIIIVGLSSETGIDLGALLLKLTVAVAVLAALIWWLSRRQRVHLPFRDLLVRYADLAPVAALALCVIGAAREQRARAVGEPRRLPCRPVRRQHHRARAHGQGDGADPEPARDDVLPLDRPTARPEVRVDPPGHRPAADRLRVPAQQRDQRAGAARGRRALAHRVPGRLRACPDRRVRVRAVADRRVQPPDRRGGAARRGRGDRHDHDHEPAVAGARPPPACVARRAGGGPGEPGRAHVARRRAPAPGALGARGQARHPDRPVAQQRARSRAPLGASGPGRRPRRRAGARGGAPVEPGRPP